MLYVVYGIGSDEVGLVGAITSPIASVNGNIVDMRQDVLHGLFTIYMLVDLGGASVTVKEFKSIVEKISADTGIKLYLERYTPKARGVDRRDMLVTLVGRDRPGIIAAITERLGAYTINIEVSEVVAREEIFLMDLLCDISRGALPVENLKPALRRTMEALGIATMFQTEDVFNKKKKIVLFDIYQSFMDPSTITEVAAQAGIDPARVFIGDPGQAEEAYVHETLGMLGGLPVPVLDAVIENAAISPGTQELVQALKGMGYRIALVSRAFDVFTGMLKVRLGLDYAFGFELPVDEDSQSVMGDMPLGLMKAPERDRIVEDIVRREGMDREDVTVITDKGASFDLTPGIRVRFDTKFMLDLMNRHALNRDTLTGVLRSFGVCSRAMGLP
jgi:predicted amino acid-binding ACT domain protein/phosphoserine phosphatase